LDYYTSSPTISPPSLTRMHFCFALAALAATWQTFGPAAAITLQTFAPCEDLSPHCPSLCATCSDAEKWPQGSHESFELGDSSEEDRPPSKNSTRPKRFAKEHGRQWIQIPADKPNWLPDWVPWWYKPRPPKEHGGGQGQQGGPTTSKPHGGQSGGGQSGGKPHGGQSGGGQSGGKPDRPNKECNDLFNGGRQLIEAFCPRSCGRCGKSTNPLTAAKLYVSYQCTVAKEPAVGLAAQK